MVRTLQTCDLRTLQMCDLTGSAGRSLGRGWLDRDDRRDRSFVVRLVGHELQCRILREDRGSQSPQLRTGIDAELVGEYLPGLSEGVERFRLAAAPIEGKHEMRAQPFPERPSRDQRFELADHLSVMTQCEVGFDAILECRYPPLLEALDVGLSEGFVSELRERRSAPQRQCLA